MADPAAARAWGRARSSRSRTQGEAFGGAKGEPEDADPAPISRVIRVRGVVESAIYAEPLGREHFTGGGQRGPVRRVAQERLPDPLPQDPCLTARRAQHRPLRLLAARGLA